MTYSTNQVSELADVSMRQMQWWDERCVISPRHEGHRRIYTEDDAVDIMLIAEFRRKGVSLQRVRRIMDKIRKMDLAEDSIILVSGIRVSNFHDSSEALAAAVKSPCSVFIVQMEPIHQAIGALNSALLRGKTVGAGATIVRRIPQRNQLLQTKLRDARLSTSR